MRYHWTEGQSITWLLDLQAQGEVVVQDMEGNPPNPQIMRPSAAMTMPLYQKVEALDDAGNATVLTEMGTIDADLTLPTIGTQHLTIDPNTGKVTAAGMDLPVPDAIKQFMGKPFRQVLSPRGEVLQMDFPFDLTELLNLGANAPLQVIKSLQQQPMIFPEEEIAIGHCWINRRDLTAQLAQTPEGAELPPITHTVIYKLAGFEDLAGTECARIELLGVQEIAGVITVPVQRDDQQVTSKVGPVYVSTSGTVWFDREAGQPLKLEATVLLDVLQESEGTVTFEGRPRDFHMQTQLHNFELTLSMVRAEEG